MHAKIKIVVFHYDVHNNCSLHSSVLIGKMNEYFDALKFKNEASRMCCADENVNLPVCHSPLEPLSKLLLYYILMNTSTILLH